MSIKLEGAKELAVIFKTLPSKVEKQIARKSLRQGTKIIQKAARDDSPVDTGQLRRSLKIKTMKRKKGRIGMIVQASPKGLPSNKSFYAAFIQYGSKKRGIAPNPFMLRAIDRT